MIDIKSWTGDFLFKAREVFADRLLFVGLQGSYARGEATETSDIDLVVILDELSAEDIRKYNALLDTMPRRDLTCGFLSGKNELLNWEPSDLFHLYYDTLPLLGSLDEILSLIDDSAIDRAIKIGACNIYHGCVHNMLYGKSERSLRGLYKSAFFVAQIRAFKQTGKYIKSRNDFDAFEDCEIVRISAELKNGGEVDFEKMSETLFAWTQKLINL